MVEERRRTRASAWARDVPPILWTVILVAKAQCSDVRRVPDKVLNDGRRRIAFEAEWREGFVGRAVTIEVDPDCSVRWMEFYDAQVGVARWIPGRGLGTIRGWDDPDETHGWSKHYGVALLDGEIDDPAMSVAGLAGLEDDSWRNLIEAALEVPDDPVVIDDGMFFAAPPPRRLTDEMAVQHRGWKPWWQQIFGRVVGG